MSNFIKIIIDDTGTLRMASAAGMQDDYLIN